MSTPGITSLGQLLRSMSPVLDGSETYVFATSRHNPMAVLTADELGEVDMLFRESEGWTIILPQETARHLDLETAFPSKKVTLNVHSSLDAVGFLAAVTTRLARDVGIGVNPVSGFYHDHLFVPEGREGEVIAVLEKMTKETKEEQQG